VGQLAPEFPTGFVRYYYLDLDKKQTEFKPGVVIDLQPFPGTIAVGPDPNEPKEKAGPPIKDAKGRTSTLRPWKNGSNMDLNELQEGSTLYLPVFVKGALLWTGDSHAAQGNGEVNLTAVETAYKEMNVTLTVLKDVKLDMPRIETPTHWITMGYDNDLNLAWNQALAQTLKFLGETRKVSGDAAGYLLADVSDCRVSQVVNIKKGIHCLTPKDTSVTGIPERPAAETAALYVTTGRDADLNKAMDTASMAMIKLLESKGVARLDAYGLASAAMDCRVGDMSGDLKNIHCVMPKSLWRK
jgi:acetamidase/formamidase